MIQTNLSTGERWMIAVEDGPGAEVRVTAITKWPSLMPAQWRTSMKILSTKEHCMSPGAGEKKIPARFGT